MSCKLKDLQVRGSNPCYGVKHIKQPTCTWYDMGTLNNQYHMKRDNYVIKR